MKRLSINVGFVTNSSSVVHHFPKALLEHPKVKAFINKFEIAGGYVGKDLWDRSQCESFLVTEEQKRDAADSIQNNRHGIKMSIAFDNPDEVYLIYGDEYESVAWSLCELLLDALCEQAGDEQVRWGRSISYN